MSKIIISNRDKISGKRVDTTESDKKFLNFMALHEYIDEAGANIIYERSKRKLWERLYKLIEYNYIDKSVASLYEIVPNKKTKRINIFSLGSEGCSEFNIRKIKSIGKEGTSLRHALYIRRLCAALKMMESDNFEYQTEYILDKFNNYLINEFGNKHSIIYPDDDTKIKIRPDIYIDKYNILLEVELSIKNKKRYAERLFWAQYMNGVSKTIWFVKDEKDKGRLMSIFSELENYSYVYYKGFNPQLISPDAIYKNPVWILDDFLENYKQNFTMLMK